MILIFVILLTVKKNFLFVKISCDKLKVWVVHGQRAGMSHPLKLDVLLLINYGKCGFVGSQNIWCGVDSKKLGEIFLLEKKTNVHQTPASINSCSVTMQQPHSSKDSTAK